MATRASFMADTERFDFSFCVKSHRCHFHTRMPLIEPGKKAPAFALKDQHAHRLADYAGRSVILYFYPKDNTPGCTRNRATSSPASLDSRRATRRFWASASWTKRARRSLPTSTTFPRRRRARGGRAVWRLAEKIALWPLFYMGIVRTTYLIGSDGIIERCGRRGVDRHAGCRSDPLAPET